MSPMEMEKMDKRRKPPAAGNVRRTVSAAGSGITPMRWMLPETTFCFQLYLERGGRARRDAEKETSRLGCCGCTERRGLAIIRDRSLGALNAHFAKITRENEIHGWYVETRSIGLIGTPELGEADNELIKKTFRKISKGTGVLGQRESFFVKVFRFLHFFRKIHDEGDNDHSATFALSP